MLAAANAIRREFNILNPFDTQMKGPTRAWAQFNHSSQEAKVALHVN